MIYLALLNTEPAISILLSLTFSRSLPPSGPPHSLYPDFCLSFLLLSKFALPPLLGTVQYPLVSCWIFQNIFLLVPIVSFFFFYSHSNFMIPDLACLFSFFFDLSYHVPFECLYSFHCFTHARAMDVHLPCLKSLFLQYSFTSNMSISTATASKCTCILKRFFSNYCFECIFFYIWRKMPETWIKKCHSAEQQQRLLIYKVFLCYSSSHLFCFYLFQLHLLLKWAPVKRKNVEGRRKMEAMHFNAYETEGFHHFRGKLPTFIPLSQFELHNCMTSNTNVHF